MWPCLNHSLQHLHLPGTIDYWNSALRPELQSKFGRCQAAGESSKFDLWGTFQSESGACPLALSNLSLGRDFNHSLGVSLPETLQTLVFGACFNQEVQQVKWPKELKHLTFGLKLLNLRDLKLGKDFRQDLRDVMLPGLLNLTIGDTLLDQTTLPTLETLTYLGETKLHFEGESWIKLCRLTLGNRFNCTLELVDLPSNLQHLTFGWEFDQSLAGMHLPCALKTLTFGWVFNQSLEEVTLPSNLQSLTFGAMFNQSLLPVNLPHNLQNLTFGRHFNCSLTDVNLPDGLESLTFGEFFNADWTGCPVICEAISYRNCKTSTCQRNSSPWCWADITHSPWSMWSSQARWSIWPIHIWTFTYSWTLDSLWPTKWRKNLQVLQKECLNPWFLFFFWEFPSNLHSSFTSFAFFPSVRSCTVQWSDFQHLCSDCSELLVRWVCASDALAAAGTMPQPKVEKSSLLGPLRAEGNQVVDANGDMDRTDL